MIFLPNFRYWQIAFGQWRAERLQEKALWWIERVKRWRAGL